MKAVCRTFFRLLADRRGATAIEYGLIAGILVLGIIASVGAFATASGDMYQEIEAAISA